MGEGRRHEIPSGEAVISLSWSPGSSSVATDRTIWAGLHERVHLEADPCLDPYHDASPQSARKISWTQIEQRGKGGEWDSFPRRHGIRTSVSVPVPHEYNLLVLLFTDESVPNISNL